LLDVQRMSALEAGGIRTLYGVLLAVIERFGGRVTVRETDLRELKPSGPTHTI